MERAKPLVPRHFQITVVAFEVTVMHLVMKGTQCQPVLVLDQQPFKTRVGCCGGQCLMLHVKQDVDGMRGDNPVDQHRAEKQQMLHRMHGEA